MQELPTDGTIVADESTMKSTWTLHDRTPRPLRTLTKTVPRRPDNAPPSSDRRRVAALLIVAGAFVWRMTASSPPAQISNVAPSPAPPR